MKKFTASALAAVFSLTLVPLTDAAADKKSSTPVPAADAPKEEKPAKPMPMHARADMIDAGAKTFTQKRKDGVEVKHVVTAKTEIKNGSGAAKFSDIKVGDYVSGLRLKKSQTEYEVLKITKFGPPAPKKADKPE